MATYYGSYVNGRRLRLDATYTQSVSGNYSTVSLKLYFEGEWAASDNTTVDISVGGVNVGTFSGYLSLNTGTSLLLSGSRRINHNSSGVAGSVAVVGSFRMPFSIGSLSVTGSLALPNIPRQPSAPTTPTASAFMTNGMTVKFNAQGNISATKYQLQRSTSSSFSSPTTVSSSGTTVVTGLTPGTTYYFRARSGNAAGWSSWSGTRTTYTLPLATTPNVDTITAVGLRVIFGRSGGTAGSTTWEFQRSTSSNFSGATTTSSTGTTSVTGLVPGTTYYFRARGKNSSGTGPWSGTRSAKTLTIAAPGLSVVSGNTGASAVATITPPSGATITNYTLEAQYLAPLPKPSGSDKTLTTTSRTPTQSGLLPGATYRWRVRANVGSTYSTAWSAWVTVTQVNPNTVDAEYFDSTYPAAAGIQYAAAVTEGVPGSVEKSVTSKYWVIAAESKSHLTMRQAAPNLAPSPGSAYRARVKAIREVDTVQTVLLQSPTGDFPALAHASYTAMCSVAFSQEATVTLALVWQGDEGPEEVESDPVTAAPGVLSPLNVSGGTPDWIESARVELRIYAAGVGTVIDLDNGFYALGSLANYFDGNMADTSQYAFGWEGTPGDSVSNREQLPFGQEADPFADPSCPSPPPPPQPPIPENECLPDVNTWRRYWSPLSSNAVSTAFDSLASFTLTTEELSDGPARIFVFENPDDLAPGEFSPGIPVSEQVVTFIPAKSEAVLDAVSERAYGRTLDSEVFQDIDHLVLGAQGGPASWPVLGCGMSYMIALDVPATSPLGNIELSARLTTRMG